MPKKIARRLTQRLSHDYRDAEDRYFDAQARASRLLHRHFPLTTGPRQRADVLRELADLADVMAPASMVFDNDRTDDDGFTPAEWNQAGSQLYRTIALTEEHLADNRSALAVSPIAGDLRCLTRPAVAAILHELCREHDTSVRASLILTLYDEVVDDLGDQTAEALASLAHVYNEIASARPATSRASTTRQAVLMLGAMTTTIGAIVSMVLGATELTLGFASLTVLLATINFVGRGHDREREG